MMNHPAVPLRLAVLLFTAAPAVALAATLAHPHARPAGATVLVEDCHVALHGGAPGTMKWPDCAGD
jgi:hypothetical protein